MSVEVGSLSKWIFLLHSFGFRNLQLTLPYLLKWIFSSVWKITRFGLLPYQLW